MFYLHQRIEVPLEWKESKEKQALLGSCTFLQQRLYLQPFPHNASLPRLQNPQSGSSITKLPSSIGELKHLRYLNVFETGNIIKLEHEFSNLRYHKFVRYVNDLNVHLLMQKIKIPMGIGRLSHLQTLTEFNLGEKKKKNACCIEELECLNLLTGVLTIKRLQNVTSGVDACRAKLKEKNHLHGLILNWNRNQFVEAVYDDRKLSSVDEAVLEGLRPHHNLKMLRIQGSDGTKLPRWMHDSSCLPNLVDYISNCKCGQLAGFGSSSSSWGGDSSSSRGEAAAATTTTTTTTTTIAFPSLKKLSLLHMPSLLEWVLPPPSATNCFPFLKVISIMSCPLLTTIIPAKNFLVLRFMTLSLVFSPSTK